MFTAKQIEAAALAYVAARQTGEDAQRAALQWARDYPQHFGELKARIACALEAAHKAEQS